MKTKVAYLETLRLNYSSFLLRCKVSQFSTILLIKGCTSLLHPQIIKIVNNSEMVGRKKTYENKSCLSRNLTSDLIIFFATINNFQFIPILMIRGCTSLVHPQIIKIVNNSETVGRKKLMKTKVAYLDVLRLTRSISFGYD